MVSQAYLHSSVLGFFTLVTVPQSSLITANKTLVRCPCYTCPPIPARFPREGIDSLFTHTSFSKKGGQFHWQITQPIVLVLEKKCHKLSCTHLCKTRGSHISLGQVPGVETVIKLLGGTDIPSDARMPCQQGHIDCT